MPLLGSAALLQLARDPATPVVTFGLEAAGFLLLLVHVGSQHVGRPRVGSSQQRAHRTARVLYMRRDVVAACDAFNARVQPPLAPCKIEQRLSSQQAATACKIGIEEDGNSGGSPIRPPMHPPMVDRSGNDNKVSLRAAPS